MRALSLTGAVAVVALLAGCQQKTPPPAPADAGTPQQLSDAGTAASQQAAPAVTAKQAVVIRGMANVPATVEIPLGGTVTWTNEDLVEHSVTAVDKSFDSKRIAPGGSWSYVATRRGTFPYVCTYHPMMKGTLVVK